MKAGLTLVLVGVTLCSFLTVLAAQDLPVSRARLQAEEGGVHLPLIDQESPNSYCGLHCVYAAAQILGASFDFDRIVRPTNLTGRHGSSASDLLDVLTEVGLTGSFRQQMSLDELRSVSDPVILHVRSPALSREYVHWVLFLGFDGSSVRMYDPPRDEGSVSISELLSIWGGTAIVVRSDRPNTTSLSSIASISPVSLSTITLVIASVAVTLVVSAARASSWLVIGIPTILLALGSHLLLPVGFLRASRVVHMVQAAYAVNSVPTINLHEAQRILQGKDKTVLVDARRRSAYERSHLPGAINLPVDSSYLKLGREIPSIVQYENVVVYCQSDQCPWAEAVARQLKARGIPKVFVYAGGVNEWQAEETGQRWADPSGQDLSVWHE